METGGSACVVPYRRVARDAGWKVFAGKKVGVLSNQTGVLPCTLEHCVDAMHGSGGVVDIRAVFGPEHGFRGAAQAGISGPGGSSHASFTVGPYTHTSFFHNGFNSRIFDQGLTPRKRGCRGGGQVH
jgi:hypothetical protein